MILRSLSRLVSPSITLPSAPSVKVSFKRVGIERVEIALEGVAEGRGRGRRGEKRRGGGREQDLADGHEQSFLHGGASARAPDRSRETGILVARSPLRRTLDTDAGPGPAPRVAKTARPGESSPLSTRGGEA